MSTTSTKSEFKFKIGADPEFIILRSDEHKLTCANTFGGSYDELGSDGDGITCEARPEPSFDPLEVVKNLRAIFSRKIMAYPDFAKEHIWVAGSYLKNKSLGGHIHIGCGTEIHPDEGACIMGQYVGLALLLLEVRSDALNRRRSGNYGKLGENRSQKHGFEFRTPSSWLTSPRIAGAALCLSRVVMHEVFNNDSFAPKRYISDADFNSVKTETLREAFPSMWEQVEQMTLYSKYAKQLWIIPELIKSKKTWYSRSRDMKVTWNLVEEKPALPKYEDVNSIWCNI